MASTSTLDDLTAGSIRRALACAAGGRIGEACSIGEAALAQGGDVGALSAMLGMLYSTAADHERAAEHLRAAHAVRSSDPVIAKNLINSLVQLDRAAEALDLLTDQVVSTDRTGHLLKLRAYLAQIADQHELSIRSYEEAVGQNPEDCEAWNNLGNVRRAVGDFTSSIDALRRAAKLDSLSAPIRLNLATALIDGGEWSEAEAELRRLAADFPLDAKPLRELHSLLKEQGRDQEALHAIEAAVEREPADIELLLGLASHLSYLLASNAAEATYRRVLAIDSENALAHLGLAVCLDLTNRTEELASLIPHAEAQGASPDALNFIRALDHRRSKRFAEGIATLEQVPAGLEPARQANLWGQLLEGAQRYDEAFAAYARMNELVSVDGNPLERAAAYRNSVRDRCDRTTDQWASRWRVETNPDARSAPVFLMGFPRSGTTLLDTMLMGHPSVEVLEEERTLDKAFELFADYDDLPTATDEQIRIARGAYFEAAGALTPLAPGNLLVDKNPLGMNAVPLIRRLFPDARIVLALRHPCDVVLSCYVTNFRLNDAMASFVRLDTTAELYDVSFRYLERVQKVMPTPTHTVVYENVVGDRDKELRGLFDFLGLDWHDAVLDHQSTARSRGRIKTASYAQVVEPIYKRSAGRWQHYRRHLEPVFPILRPWVEKFGYEF